MQASARMNRRFLRRTVQFLLRCGARQFLDLGSGVPTVGNVHEIAFAVDPSCRVASWITSRWLWRTGDACCPATSM